MIHLLWQNPRLTRTENELDPKRDSRLLLFDQKVLQEKITQKKHQQGSKNKNKIESLPSSFLSPLLLVRHLKMASWHLVNPRSRNWLGLGFYYSPMQRNVILKYSPFAVLRSGYFWTRLRKKYQIPIRKRRSLYMRLILVQITAFVMKLFLSQR